MKACICYKVESTMEPRLLKQREFEASNHYKRKWYSTLCLLIRELVEFIKVHSCQDV